MSEIALKNSNSPFSSFGNLIAPFFSKKNGLLQSFEKTVNKSTIRKMDKLIVELDETILDLKEVDCDFSNKQALELIEEGKFLVKLAATIESLVSDVDVKDDLVMEISTKFKILGDRVETIIVLAETYNEVKEMKKEIEEGKTISDIDEAFTI